MSINAKLGSGTVISISTDAGTTYTAINGITSLGGTGQTKPEIDVTPLEASSKEYISGMNEGESKTISFYRDSADAGQNALKTEAMAGNVALFKVVFSNAEEATFEMALLGWTIDEPSGDAAITATVTGRMTGDITWA